MWKHVAVYFVALFLALFIPLWLIIPNRRAKSPKHSFGGTGVQSLVPSDAPSYQSVNSWSPNTDNDLSGPRRTNRPTGTLAASTVPTTPNQFPLLPPSGVSPYVLPSLEPSLAASRTVPSTPSPFFLLSPSAYSASALPSLEPSPVRKTTTFDDPPMEDNPTTATLITPSLNPTLSPAAIKQSPNANHSVQPTVMGQAAPTANNIASKSSCPSIDRACNHTLSSLPSGAPRRPTQPSLRPATIDVIPPVTTPSPAIDGNGANSDSPSPTVRSPASIPATKLSLSPTPTLSFSGQSTTPRPSSRPSPTITMIASTTATPTHATLSSTTLPQATGPSVPPSTKVSDTTDTESESETSISNDFPERWKSKSSYNGKVGNNGGRSKSAYKLGMSTKGISNRPRPKKSANMSAYKFGMATKSSSKDKVAGTSNGLRHRKSDNSRQSMATYKLGMASAMH